MSDGSLSKKPEQPQVPSDPRASEQSPGNAKSATPDCSPAPDPEDEIDDGGWLCI